MDVAEGGLDHEHQCKPVTLMTHPLRFFLGNLGTLMGSNGIRGTPSVPPRFGSKLPQYMLTCAHSDDSSNRCSRRLHRRPVSLQPVACTRYYVPPL